MISWPIVIVMMLFLGFVLLLLELFVIPGFGPVGVGAILFLAIGAYLSWTKLSYAWGIGVTLISIISLILSIYLFKRMGLANKFVLAQNVSGKNDEKFNNQPVNEKLCNQGLSVGATGITISDLRPSGIAEFQDNRLNVIADGIYIKRGEKIRIVKIEGNKIFVEEE